MPEDDRFYSTSKLLAHMDRLDEWIKTGHSRPIQAYLEITNRCNHDCPGCIGFRGDGEAEMTLEQAKRVIGDFKKIGVKGVLMSGGGDPTVHPHFGEILRDVVKNDMEVGLITNGQKLSKQNIETIVDDCTFIRVSLDADSPETHMKTHAAGPNAYGIIMRNIDSLVERKRQSGSRITIGYSYLFGEFSAGNLYDAARRARDQGVNYVRFKPFFKLEETRDFVTLPQMNDKASAETIFDELKRAKSELESESFSISFPADRAQYHLEANGKVSGSVRNVPYCYVPHFFVTVTPDMMAYPCCIIKGVKESALGNLNEKSLVEIWNSESTRRIHERIDLKRCPNPCQFNHHVQLLDRLKGQQKQPHANFL